ncbi:leucyl aminopeptidase [Rhodobacteraceae bacterium 2376]|uniref:Probable cytosol aminopeptidase n=1 Tax=Rhabdonatronobacter sediminivivens TaxID=2743469 RepID=A0A7Z0I290_9RHOB|nr:leucyl aminopeptidase [Rhabdonatronobacter sediminivivens]NYS26189.1 leucyl aminopeptidase [Rhabdonatronobacter sediminivivens]
MSRLLSPIFSATDPERIATQPGRIAVFATPGSSRFASVAQRVNRLTRGALRRLVDSEAFDKLKPGAAMDLTWPAGMEAEAVQVIRMERKPDAEALRRAGVAIGKAHGKTGTLVAAEGFDPAPLVLGALLRAYRYDAQKSAPEAEAGPFELMAKDPEAAQAACTDAVALADAVHFTRDLVNAPANILTTETFAAQIEEMRDIGLEVEVLDEPAMEKLGMGALLGVGYGSECPSKLVIMRWQGGAADAAPLAVVGKGVMFDTGGISIKPSAGMEDMTMDMGGSAVTAGLMRALALRKARANVVGVVGLVENMPDGRAQRPGDVVRSMKGDTIEVINTDAEGRLVLADAMWYTADRFKPAAMIDLATLTGAMIVALGHEKAGVFANDDTLADGILKAAASTGEGAWRMPLDPAYDKLIKSRIADVKNVGGRTAGSITAAQFLQRFVPEGTPWAHIDIAGVALVKEDTAFAPKGATGWGVMALDALVRTRFEES